MSSRDICSSDLLSYLIQKELKETWILATHKLFCIYSHALLLRQIKLVHSFKVPGTLIRHRSYQFLKRQVIKTTHKVRSRIDWRSAMHSNITL